MKHKRVVMLLSHLVVMFMELSHKLPCQTYFLWFWYRWILSMVQL